MKNGDEDVFTVDVADEFLPRRSESTPAGAGFRPEAVLGGDDRPRRRGRTRAGRGWT